MRIYSKNSKISFVGTLAFSLALFITSCNKKDDFNPLEENSWALTLSLGDAVSLKSQVPSNIRYTKGEWIINGNVVSNEESIQFKEYKAGTYDIEFIAYNDKKVFSKKGTIEVEQYAITATTANSMFATQLFEYTPAPGQFINKSPGDLASAKSVLGTKTGLVTLGAFGGSIVLGFEKSILNKEGDDIVIYNNAFTNFAEPGVIWVMEDTNGNGKPDDIWYEIKGSEYGKEGYIRNYTVTYIRPEPITANVPWKDNLGVTGEIKKIGSQSHFPLWLGVKEYTVKGTLLPSTNIVFGNFVTSGAFDKGYADNAAGNDEIDIADAMDENGNTVSLNSIRFVKIQTGILADMKSLGELSTEIKGVEGLNF